MKMKLVKIIIEAMKFNLQTLKNEISTLERTLDISMNIRVVQKISFFYLNFRSTSNPFYDQQDTPKKNFRHFHEMLRVPQAT